MTEYRVRASSWGSLFDCAYKWQGEHLLGMRKPSSPRALLGTAIHAGTAAFDQGRVDGTGISAYDAAQYVVETIQNPEFDVDWSTDDLRPAEAEKIGLALHTKYCTEVSPRYEFASVEMATEPFPIDCGGGITIVLTGTLDRLRVKKSAGHGIQDLKSGAQAVQKGEANTKGHRPQVGTYELLYEHSTGNIITEPAEIIGLKTKGAPEIATGEIINAKQLMVGTDDYPGLIQFAADMFRTGLFPPNPKSMLCNPKFCARWDSCFYHD